MTQLRGVAPAVALLAVLTACVAGDRLTEASPTLPASSATSAAPSPTASPPTSDAVQQTTPASPSPPALPVAVQLAECEHSMAAYRVHLPSGWWTNPEFQDDELGPISACRFFAPQAFDVTSGDLERPVPDGAAIWMEFLDGGCVGYINPILESHETTVDGYPSTVSELAEGKLATNPASTYEYVVSLTPETDCDAGGRYIYALTKREFPGDYEENKTALDDMMGLLEVDAEVSYKPSRMIDELLPPDESQVCTPGCPFGGGEANGT